jgi:hypothetical protein
MSNPNISSTFILKKNVSGNEWINPPSTYYWWVCWAKEKPLLRSDNTPLMVEDVWYDLLAGTVKVYNGTQFTPAGVIGNSNNGFITENVEFRIVDQNTNPITQTGILSFYGGDVPTRIYQIEVENGKLNIRKADGQIVMNLDAAGNATFTKNVTVTGDLFADDVGYDEALINLLRINTNIQSSANASTYIGFTTDTIALNASNFNATSNNLTFQSSNIAQIRGSGLAMLSSGASSTTSIILQDDALTNKVTITGDTKFVDEIIDVPDIYLQNHIHHFGDNNTRIGFPANDEIALRTNGVDRINVISNGNVGIGTATPEVQLDVRGVDSEIQVVATSGNPTISLSNAEGPSARREFIVSYNTAVAGGGRTDITSIDQGNNFTSISMLCSGVRIGGASHVTPGATLDVAGNTVVSGFVKPTSISDGTSSIGTNGQVLTSTGTGLLWNELTPRFFYDTNATFNGTSGHRIYVSVQKKGTLYVVQVNMLREGGIHFDLVSPANTVGTQIIATLPVGWRPPSSVDGIGFASNNNTWASGSSSWGSLNIDTDGNIRMRSPAAGGPVTTIQPNLEQIHCSIFWLTSGTVYNADGITR